jgi:hypothetical protein
MQSALHSLIETREEILRVDVGVAEVVDQLREQLNQLAPKRRFFRA